MIDYKVKDSALLKKTFQVFRSHQLYKAAELPCRMPKAEEGQVAELRPTLQGEKQPLTISRRQTSTTTSIEQNPIDKNNKTTQKKRTTCNWIHKTWVGIRTKGKKANANKNNMAEYKEASTVGKVSYASGCAVCGLMM